MSHYDVLGVSRNASTTEIRRAYLDLARAHHPDFHATEDRARRGDAERTMQLINEAWLVLGDRRRRADYDLSLPATVREWPAGTAHPDFVPFDPDPEPGPGRDGGERYDRLGFDEDEPGTGRRVPPWQQILPVASFTAALASFIGALVLGGRFFLALGVFFIVAAGAGFMLIPMLEVLRTYERDPER